MEPEAYTFGRFRLDPVRRVLRRDGLPLRLGSRAVDLLIVLVRQRDRVVSKRELFDRVWPDLVVEENNLQQHVSALRKLLGAQAIATVPGRGYQFILPLGGDAADGADAAASATPPMPPVPRGNLPLQASPLIGREADLAELRARLATHALVSVVGPGGVGKTRLAGAAASAALDEHPDGVWAVDLSALDDAARLPAAVAQSLDVELPMGHGDAPTTDAAAAVAAALRLQRLLLVLDNCEHVLDAAADLVAALRLRAPGVRVLVTSQEPLGLDDEQVLRLGPLPLPPEGTSDAGQALRFGAVQLLVQRAQAVDRGFEVGDEHAAALVDICRALDGLPLAIELAAARLPLLGVRGLRQRLDGQLRLLARRDGRAAPRQQTLRAALDWSHALLDAGQQALFRRLAVFSGGFSLDLVQRVLAGDDAQAGWSVLDQLGALVDKSLVVLLADDGPRYRLLEAARAFALERLADAGEEATWRLRHAEALAEMLEAFDAAVAREARFEPLVQRLAPELDNLRAALRWLEAAGGGDGLEAAAARRIARRLAAHSDWLWLELDPYGDGLALCRTARGWLDDEVPVRLAARLRQAWTTLARTRGLPAEQWAADARQAVEGFRAAGDRVGLYRALCQLGGAPRAVVGEAEAGAALDEAQRLEDPQWSPRLRMRRQVSLEWFHDLGGRLPASREAGLACLALARAAGGRAEIAVLGNLADTEFALGHVDAAIALCRQAMQRAEALGRPELASNAYEHLVPALIERGELDAAEAMLRTGRAVHVRAFGAAYTLLLPLALLTLRRGRPQTAARLLGCAASAYAHAGQDMHPPERRPHEAVWSALATVCTDAERAARVRQGQAWSEDEGFAVLDDPAAPDGG